MRITIAIFAALVLTCFSKPISSSVGARHVFAAEAQEKTYTAVDYVQDGLVSMWDGIENAGWGLHDDFTETWVNLVDERYPFTMLDYGHWGVNGWVNSGDFANMRTFAPYSYITCEIVMTPSPTYHNNAIRKVLTVRPTGRSTRSLFIDATSQNVAGHSSQDVPCAHFPYKIGGFTVSCSLVYSSESDSAVIIAAYASGIRSQNVGHITWSANIYDSKGGGNIIMVGDDTNNGSGDMIIHSLRPYDRQLSDDEVAYNALIDQARFGL